MALVLVIIITQQPGPLSLLQECRGFALIDREVHSVANPPLLCHKELSLSFIDRPDSGQLSFTYKATPHEGGGAYTLHYTWDPGFPLTLDK